MPLVHLLVTLTMVRDERIELLQKFFRQLLHAATTVADCGLGLGEHMNQAAFALVRYLYLAVYGWFKRRQ
jgi:hypothetical protein